MILLIGQFFDTMIAVSIDVHVVPETVLSHLKAAKPPSAPSNGTCDKPNTLFPNGNSQ